MMSLMASLMASNASQHFGSFIAAEKHLCFLDLNQGRPGDVFFFCGLVSVVEDCYSQRQQDVNALYTLAEEEVGWHIDVYSESLFPSAVTTSSSLLQATNFSTSINPSVQTLYQSINQSID